MSGALALWACEPNVVIGAKLAVEEQPGGESGSGGFVSGGTAGTVAGAGSNVGGSVGGSEPVVAGASGSGDAGASSAGAGGAPPEVESWCATAPWLDKPVTFTNDDGNVIPAGNYVLTYVSGAQLHDVGLGYEVTGHYYYDSIEAGHHLFSGDTLGEVGATKLWLEDTGLIKFGATGTIAEVEAANRGYTWPFAHVGGELHITLLDNVYTDNEGPGSRFCASAAAPP